MTQSTSAPIVLAGGTGDLGRRIASALGRRRAAFRATPDRYGPASGTLMPRSDAVFPARQGMQYLRDMASGRGKLEPLDDDRYGKRTRTSVRDLLAPVA